MMGEMADHLIFPGRYGGMCESRESDVFSHEALFFGFGRKNCVSGNICLLLLIQVGFGSTWV
jgi:hypothetical protein